MSTARAARGAITSPNIWHHPEVYELENRAVDPDRVIESTMAALRPLAGATLLDLGCGNGFHLPRWAEVAGRVIGIEPYPPLLAGARRRTTGLRGVDVRQGSAQATGLPDASVDVVHARWAYFFDERCEPGLREVARVVRRGGSAFLIDNDAHPEASTFSRWFSEAYRPADPDRVDRFFARHGYETLRRMIRWEFERREDFEAVVRIEFKREAAERIIASHRGSSVDYAIVIRHRAF